MMDVCFCFTVNTQGLATEVNAVGSEMTAYIFNTSVRDYTMQARLGKDLHHQCKGLHHAGKVR